MEQIVIEKSEAGMQRRTHYAKNKMQNRCANCILGVDLVAQSRDNRVQPIAEMQFAHPFCVRHFALWMRACMPALTMHASCVLRNGLSRLDSLSCCLWRDNDTFVDGQFFSSKVHGLQVKILYMQQAIPIRAPT